MQSLWLCKSLSFWLLRAERVCWCMLALHFVLDTAVSAERYYPRQFCDRWTFDLIQPDPVFSKLYVLPIVRIPSSCFATVASQRRNLQISKSQSYLCFSLLTGMVTMAGRALERSFSSLLELHSPSIKSSKIIAHGCEIALLHSLSTVGWIL